MSRRGKPERHDVLAARLPPVPWSGPPLVLLGAAGLVAIVCTAYLPALRAGYIWDDPRYVTDNPTLRSAAGLWRIWADPGATVQYYPLVFTSFWLEYHLWGLPATGYHIVNVFLHSGNALLLWLVLRRLGVPGAWVAACLFAIHPLQVESVAWVTERKNVLSGLFYLAALLAYLRYTGLGADATPPAWTGRRYAVVVLLFMGALLSKTVTASLPAAILLLIWWRRGRLGWRDILPTLPLFALGIAGGAVTAWFEKHNVRAVGEAWDLAAVERVMIAGRAVWFYLGKLLWPAGLSFNYPRWTPDATQVWPWLFPVAAVGLLGLLWGLRRRVGRGPLAAVLFYGGTLVPALGFINTYPMRYSFVADHFQYLACVGPIVLLTAVVAHGLATRAVARRVLGGVLLLVALVLTNRYARVFASEETLWTDVLSKNPDSFLAHNNLGAMLRDRQQPERARAHFAAAVRVAPRFYEGLFNLGRAHEDTGQLDAALEQYRQAQGVRPDKAEVYNGLGSVLGKLGRVDEALQQYEQALARDPQLDWARINLANALAQQGRRTEAIAHYEAALRDKPDWALAHRNLANALAQEERFADALTHFDRSLQLEPNNATAHRNRGHALSSLGRFDEALEAYRQAIRLAPQDPGPRCDLASTLRQRGQLEAAIQEYQEALRIAPHDERARRGLAAAQAQRDGK